MRRASPNAYVHARTKTRTRRPIHRCARMCFPRCMNVSPFIFGGEAARTPFGSPQAALPKKTRLTPRRLDVRQLKHESPIAGCNSAKNDKNIKSPDCRTQFGRQATSKSKCRNAKRTHKPINKISLNRVRLGELPTAQTKQVDGGTQWGVVGVNFRLTPTNMATGMHACICAHITQVCAHI